MQRDGRCAECGDPAVWGACCIEHLIKAREKQRDNLGRRKRYQNSMSYRIQEDPEGFLRDVARMREVLKPQAARLKKAG